MMTLTARCGLILQNIYTGRHEHLCIIVRCTRFKMHSMLWHQILLQQWGLNSNIQQDLRSKQASLRVCKDSTNTVHAADILPAQNLFFSKIQEGKQPRYPPKAPFNCWPHSTHPFVEHALLRCWVGPAIWFQQQRS